MPTSEELSADDLYAIEARLNAATPGPWRSVVEGRDQDSGSSFIMTEGEDIYLSGATDADQDFIAHSRPPGHSPVAGRSPKTAIREQVTFGRAEPRAPRT